MEIIIVIDVFTGTQEYFTYTILWSQQFAKGNLKEVGGKQKNLPHSYVHEWHPSMLITLSLIFFYNANIS